MVLYTGSFCVDLLAVTTALVAVAYAYFKWTYQYWKRQNVPYIEPRIPFGSLRNPFAESGGEQIMEFYKEAKSKGWKYCGIYSVLTPTLLIVDLDLIKLVLSKDFQYFTDRGAYVNERDDPVGCHLFAIGGSKWRNLRAKLTPTFTSGKLKSMFQTLVDCGLVLEKYIEQNVTTNKEPVDIKNILACFSTDVIGSCAFGLNCNSFKDPNSAFRKYGNKIFSISKLRGLQMMIVTSFPSMGKVLGIRQVPKDVADFFTKVVQDTVTYREKNNVMRKDFLQLLIDLRRDDEAGHENKGDGNSLSMEEMVAQSFVFFAAGFETSASTTTFALFELATHPEIQDRVRAEINEVLAQHDNQISYDSINDMKYLGQVIDETMRLRSVARLLRRVCNKDYKVPGEDLVIEKGTRVIVSIRGTQYDEEYWENPQEFNPDRFSEEKKKNMNQYTHMPFGQGPRACIGERFGLMQVKVGLTCLLRKFKVNLSEKTKLPLKMSASSVVASAEGGIWLNFEKI
ncbi:hypothetical protein NQ315_007347 [Exocentrus adspersus]|uniref:Cytochrome P450 n=1 Tax=Exocentrus adspersus TaxID=1586481 RepID=A0AAV8VHS5_9CUCU|nr:hypothetical protein NQ315_007347 [Exocentrus adspersus]